MTIPELADELNRQSVEFEIGSLQEIRKRLRGLTQIPCRGIFGKQSIKANGDGRGYAFHVGGRKELQFNIGYEQRDEGEMIRYGVAFSLELSQTLPRLEPLLPKILRFNVYVTERSENLPSVVMWHHDASKNYLSEDRQVGPIPDDLVKSGVFIMLGKRVAIDDVDFREILVVFDSLLRLYRYVEGEEQVPLYAIASDFNPGCPTFIERTIVCQTAQTVDVALRHRTLQKALYTHLRREAGENNVDIERHLDIGVSVDASVRCNNKETFYEVKIASTVRSCVRAALGQLIEYCHWPLADRAIEMIVVGEAELDSDSKAYLDLLREKYGLPIWYRRIDIENDVLEGKA